MNTYECPGCGNTLTESEETCKYCGAKNPIFSGEKKKATSYVYAYDPKGEKIVKNQIDSTGLGFLLGFIFGWIGIIISAAALRGKKSIKGSIAGCVVVYSILAAIALFAIIFSSIMSAISASHTNHIDMITSGMQLVEFFRCQLALL